MPKRRSYWGRHKWIRLIIRNLKPSEFCALLPPPRSLAAVSRCFMECYRIIILCVEASNARKLDKSFIQIFNTLVPPSEFKTHLFLCSFPYIFNKYFTNKKHQVFRSNCILNSKYCCYLINLILSSISQLALKIISNHRYKLWTPITSPIIRIKLYTS